MNIYIKQFFLWQRENHGLVYNPFDTIDLPLEAMVGVE